MDMFFFYSLYVQMITIFQFCPNLIAMPAEIYFVLIYILKKIPIIFNY